MATANPYATPEAALERRPQDGAEEFDQTGPLSARGRFGRITYLYWNIAYGVLFMLAFSLISGVVGAAGEETAAGALGAIGGLLMMALLGFMIAAYWIIVVRRLHDLNWSGWLTLLMLVPIASTILALILMFGSGTAGHNDYGPPPKPYTGFQLVIACLLPALFIVGIIAAIAIPAYSNYVASAGAM